jgi:hypothetical protein
MNKDESVALAVVGGIAAFIIAKALIITTINRVVPALGTLPSKQ